MSQITIQQYAGQLNLANSDMLWEVTSVSSSAPQYQYVCALQDGCGTTLTTIKQQQNNNIIGIEYGAKRSNLRTCRTASYQRRSRS